MIFGVHGANEYDRSDIISHAEIDNQIGARIVRAGVPWFITQPNGPNQPIDFTYTDQFVNHYFSKDIAILMVISTSPEWINHTSNPNFVPTNAYFDKWIDDYRNYTRACVEHFKGRIHHWELWNEPNMKRFWSTMMPSQYAVWASEMHKIIKSIDPSAIVMYGGGVTSWTTNSSDRKHGGMYFKKIVQLAPKDVTDFSIHTYGGLSQVDTARRILNHQGFPHGRLWITEAGCKTTNDDTQLKWWKSFIKGLLKKDYGVDGLIAFWDYWRPSGAIDEGNDINPYSIFKDGKLRKAGEFLRDTFSKEVK